MKSWEISQYVSAVVGAGVALAATLALAAEGAPVPQDVPELMRCADGTQVTTVAQWGKRRGEILDFFTREVYGKRPVERPDGLRFEPAEADAVMMDGAAIRKRIRASWRGPRGEGSFVFTAFVPRRTAEKGGKAPAFVLICNRPPEENLDPARRVKSYFWPAEEIVDRGYAAIALYNGDIAPDDPRTAFTQGVHRLWGERGTNTWGTLSAWAWGASRVMDWIETEKALDARHVAVVGHSRGGKTALLAGVLDTRFALACVNDSGCSGAKLNHIALPKSESVAAITRVFPHWFSSEYARWAGREREMPFDQHELIALMAPRLVAIGSASEDDWAGQLGEFHAAYLASSAWGLYGKRGLVAPDRPPTDGARPVAGLAYQDGSVSYHIRPGTHTLSAYDWHRYMDFADRHGWTAADDSARLQALLDRGGEVRFPAGEFTVGRTLVVRPGTHLVCAPGFRARLGDGANCAILANRDAKTNLVADISVEGGLWDGNNAHQDRSKYSEAGFTPPLRYGARKYGQLIVFSGVKGLRLKGLTVKDPQGFSIMLTDVEDFAVEDITFDCNDRTGNEDGVHVNGFARRGRIRGIRGHTNDDLVALNSDEGDFRSDDCTIEDVLIEDLDGGERGYTGVRLLSRHAQVRNVTVRNIRGKFQYNVVSFTHWAGKGYRPGMGHFDNILIEDITATSCRKSGCGHGGLIWFQDGVQDVGAVTIRRMRREEGAEYRNVVPTIEIGTDARIRDLKLEDVTQKLSDDRPLVLRR